MMEMAIMKAAKTIANAIFCFSKISFQRFSGVIFSIIQKAIISTRIPNPEYTNDAMIYFMLMSSFKIISFICGKIY